jgi:hypothetical protein
MMRFCIAGTAWLDRFSTLDDARQPGKVLYCRLRPGMVA